MSIEIAILILMLLCLVMAAISRWRTKKDHTECIKRSLPAEEPAASFYYMFFEDLAKKCKMKLFGTMGYGGVSLWERPWHDDFEYIHHIVFSCLELPGFRLTMTKSLIR